MKQMTKKELEAFIENKWGELCNEYGYDDPKYYKVRSVSTLCEEMPLSSGWIDYWNKINTECYTFMWSYFEQGFSAQEISILRLITLHLFVRHKFPERKKKRGVKR